MFAEITSAATVQMAVSNVALNVWHPLRELSVQRLRVALIIA